MQVLVELSCLGQLLGEQGSGLGEPRRGVTRNESLKLERRILGEADLEEEKELLTQMGSLCQA